MGRGWANSHPLPHERLTIPVEPNRVYSLSAVRWRVEYLTSDETGRVLENVQKICFILHV